jgi:hypothetical protein
MKPKVIRFSFVVGLILLLSFSVIAIAEQPNKLPAIQTPTNGAAGQINESENDTTNPAAKLPEETNSGSSYSIKSDCVADWRFVWFGENSDGGYKITTTELQEAIHCWLDDIPVRYHTMSTMDLQEIISAWLTPLINHCHDNCEYGWAPSEWTELEINVFSDHVYVGNCFKWNDDHMKAFKDLNSYYQYEIRRDKDVWDYFYCENGECKGDYLTNLPFDEDKKLTDEFCEEKNLPWCCPWRITNDEEFELKVFDSDNLKANEWYYVYANLAINSEKKGTTLYVQTQSKYCGKLPFCGGKFGWCDMTRNTVTT